MISIEFFHDVICSFCFPMSYRMRQLQKELPNIEIVHRSFALVRDDNDFNLMFGSRAKAKEQIVEHWVHANNNDDLHRFNISGMMATDFPFPASMVPLRVCKAAGLVHGQDAYWNVFDALQEALFVKNLNIEELSVLQDCIKSTGVNQNLWEKQFADDKTLTAIFDDFKKVSEYNITSVPCLIVDGHKKISGAISLPELRKELSSLQN